MNFNLFRSSRKKRYIEIAPHEVLIDSSNIPQFDIDQFEGRLERPISRATIYVIGIVGVLILTIFAARTAEMQIMKGDWYSARSSNNMLRPIPLFAGRGVIYDRTGALLAWNAPRATEVEERFGVGDAVGSNGIDLATILSASTSSIDHTMTEAELKKALAGTPVAHREYATSSGLAHILGYVQYPSKDKNGFYFQEDFEGVAGVEKYFNDHLKGVNGSRLVEVDARGKIVSENTVRPSIQGENLTLSIDARVQSALYRNIKDIAERVGFTGGAGIIMDVHTGEILALTSYPEYSSQIMSDKTDVRAVRQMLNDGRLLFLDRAIDGLYVPGSILKPYMALAALSEGVIDSRTVIHTTGSISIPNPYDPTRSTVFRDWKNHGSVDLRKALAVSSDVYFYVVGGGYKDQVGIGIRKIDEYMNMFGFGIKIPESFFSGKQGTIPTPEWKKKTFGEDWYLGNTYHTVIGQYGFQVTPVQTVRAVAALANKGILLTPTVLKGDGPHIDRVIDLPKKNFDVVREGMRQSITDGTGKALDLPYVEVAGKSGTAELGITKANVNSWMTGFWPYKNPRYAFAVILEKGSVHNLIGAAAVMRQQLDWMHLNTPEYLVQ